VDKASFPNLAMGMMAGYAPATKVVNHSHIDRDQEAIEDCFSGVDWVTCAKDIYENGRYSAKSDTVFRTIHGFSTSAESKFGPLTVKQTATTKLNPYIATGQNFTAAKEFETYYQSWTYADEFVRDALDGTGVWAGVGGQSRWAGVTGSAANLVAARKQAVKKGTVNLATNMYSLYEYFTNMWKANFKTSLSAEYLSYKLVHGWDEGWAFYAGSLESGAGDGYGPYALAEKRAKSFGTDDAPGPAGSKSRVNFRMLGAAQAGRRALSSKPFANESKTVGETAQAAYNCLAAQAFVPLLQACLLYTWKASVCDFNAKDCGSYYGEAYAFCSAVVPRIAAVDAAAAQVVLGNVDMTTVSAVPSGYSATRAAIYENLNKMDVKCVDMGACADCGDTTDSAFWASLGPFCEDDTVGEACGVAWPSEDTTSTTEVEVEVKRTSAGNDPWKFTAIMCLTIYGSIVFAVLLTYAPRAWAWVFSTINKGCTKETAPTKDDEMGVQVADEEEKEGV